MTKKHFIALADAIRQYEGLQRVTGVYPSFMPEHLNTLADFCQSQNPDFNRERWFGYIAGTNGKNGKLIDK